MHPYRRWAITLAFDARTSVNKVHMLIIATSLCQLADAEERRLHDLATAKQDEVKVEFAAASHAAIDKARKMAQMTEIAAKMRQHNEELRKFNG